MKTAIILAFVALIGTAFAGSVVTTTTVSDVADVASISENAYFTFNASVYWWPDYLQPFLADVIFQDPGYTAIGQRVELTWLGIRVYWQLLARYTQIPYGATMETQTVYELLEVLHDRYWPTFGTDALRLSDCSGNDVAPRNRDKVEQIQGKYRGEHEHQADENGWTFYGLVHGDFVALEHAYQLPDGKSSTDQVAEWQSRGYPEWQHMEGWFLFPDGQGGFIEVHGWTGWWYIETNKTLEQIKADVVACNPPAEHFIENVAFDQAFLCFAGTGDLIGCGAQFRPVTLGGSKRSEVQTWSGHYGHPALRNHLAAPHKHYDMSNEKIVAGVKKIQAANGF